MLPHGSGPGNRTRRGWGLDRKRCLETRPRRAGELVGCGRYPGMERFCGDFELAVLERLPGEGDLPDPACEYVLPRSDWVFITASAIPNKTFPRLAELSRDAQTVLMGPGTPWLPELAEFGIDYLAATRVVDGEVLRRTVTEGGGVRIFGGGVRYFVARIRPIEQRQS